MFEETCSCNRKIPKELIGIHQPYKYFKEHGLEYIVKDKDQYLFLCTRCGQILGGSNKK